MAFPDSSWPCGCDSFCAQSMSPEKEKVTIFWNIESFLRECQKERKELRSDVFGFADATWNLFASFGQKEVHSLFGINVRPLRLSDAVLDCHCEIELRGGRYPKKIERKFKCESTDSHWVKEKFLSNSELKEFLRGGEEIVCCIFPKKSSIKEVSPRTEITLPSRSSAVDAHTQDQLFPDSTWSCDSDSWCVNCTSSKDVSMKWLIGSFLRKCQEEKNGLRSYDFGFADARWNLCISLDRKNNNTLFGINFKPYRFSDEVFDCNCTIRLCNCGYAIKRIDGRFKCGNAVSQWATEDFLSKSELEDFILRCNEINCTIYLRKLSIKEACPGAASIHSSSNGAMEDQAQTRLLKSNKVCHDLKQLMLSEEYSDVTLQVRDQQFKAHRLILAARSSVFAATFRCNMKEKATGVVEIKDCDPSSFPVLLEFIYTGCTDKLSVENVFGIYTSADKYDVQELKLDCLEFMKNNLNIETFCETVRLSMMHSETSLLKVSIDFFAKNMKKIIVTAKWQSFILENPIQGNEILIKALGAYSQGD